MGKALRVAAVVVTYNRLALLRQCLAALQAQTVAPAAVFVIDNASTDGTAKRCTPWRGRSSSTATPAATLAAPAGLPYGVREAALAGYDALWLMDDDTLPQPQALEALLQADEALDGAYWLAVEPGPGPRRQRPADEPPAPHAVYRPARL